MDYVRDIFESALKSKIFESRERLFPDYVPSSLPHRENEIEKIASVLAPALRGERPNNILIYGPIGTGKTTVIKYVLSRLEASAKELGSKVKGIYVDTQYRDTPYMIIANIVEAVGAKLYERRGKLSIMELLKRITEKISNQGYVYVIVLDHLELVKKINNLPYTLMKINEELLTSKISLVGITNNVDMLSPRVKSVLGEVEIMFPPYNVGQLKDILKLRAKEAFKPEVLEEDIIAECASLAENAKTALDLLRIAGEIAERLGSEKVSREHIMKAREKIERGRIVDAVRTLPLTSKLVLASIIAITKEGHGYTTTGEVYEKYKELAAKLEVETVTSRRISDILEELDMLGVISGKVVSKGRYGKTRIIELKVDADMLAKALHEYTLFDFNF